MNAPLSVSLMSGGPDALLAAHMAREECGQVEPLFVEYGQHAFRRERQCAERCAEFLGADLMVTKIDLYAQLKVSGLVAENSRSSVGRPISEYVPFRNTVFLALATALAEARGAQRIYVGAIGAPWVTPDNSPEYFRRMNAVISEGSLPESSIEVVAPLNLYDKRRVISESLDRGLPLGLTWSCHNEDDLPCQDCGNCRSRREAFDALGVVDPVTVGAEL